MKETKFPEAKIALCKCQENRKPYGIRFERYEDEWMATWSFLLKKDGAAEREHYNKTQLKGLIRRSNDYPGCPYKCGERGYVICDCGGLNCNSKNEQEMFTCGWCGQTYKLQEYKGEGFDASGDR